MKQETQLQESAQKRGGNTPRIFNLGTRWRLEVTLTLLLPILEIPGSILSLKTDYLN